MEGRRFGTMTLALIPVAIAINLAVGQLVYAAGLPLYLDSIGTVLVGVLAGPWAGALTGLVSNILWGFLGNVIYAPFATVAAVIGALAGLFREQGWFKSALRAALAGLVTGLVAAILSAPIAAYVFGGTTGNLGTDALVAAFRQAGLDVLGASMAQGTFSDPLDKGVTFLIVWLVVTALPARTLSRFPGGEDR
jgi:energy-coupling factor transport system substrate-specific component